MSKKSIPQKEVKLLWGRSGSRCAKCQKDIIRETVEDCDYLIGKMAHIEGENPGSARYNQNMTDKDRNKYENLILLCPNCHDIIDNDPDKYTIDKIKQIKKDHENWVRDSLRTHMPNVSFAELEVIVKHLTSVSIPESGSSINVIPPEEKIKRNNLSTKVANLITMGMLQVKQVKDYLNKNPDIQFAERLKAGFANRYMELKNEGLDSDALFYELLNFTSHNPHDFTSSAAGLSVLTYFFELCEVFEK